MLSHPDGIGVPRVITFYHGWMLGSDSGMSGQMPTGTHSVMFIHT